MKAKKGKEGRSPALVICLFLEDYFTSLSPVPIWGIALIKRTATQDSLENYVCKLFGPGPALNGRSINGCSCQRVVSGARGLDADWARASASGGL